MIASRVSDLSVVVRCHVERSTAASFSGGSELFCNDLQEFEGLNVEA